MSADAVRLFDMPLLVLQEIVDHLDMADLKTLYHVKRDVFAHSQWQPYWYCRIKLLFVVDWRKPIREKKLDYIDWSTVNDRTTYSLYRDDPIQRRLPPYGVAYIRLGSQACLHCGECSVYPHDMVCDMCRRHVLQSRLDEHGLQIRTDSKLCRLFMCDRLPPAMNLDAVVDMCVEMNWLYQHTPYKRELGTAISDTLVDHKRRRLHAIENDLDLDEDERYMSRAKAHKLCEGRVRAEILERYPLPVAVHGPAQRITLPSVGSPLPTVVTPLPAAAHEPPQRSL